MTTRCVLTELYVDQCAHCRGLDLKVERTRLGPWIEANYRSRCIECDDIIEPGDQIRGKETEGFLCGPCGGAWW